MLFQFNATNRSAQDTARCLRAVAAGALLSCVAPAVSGTARATTLGYRYEFDASTLQLIESAREIAVYAGSLPRTWESGQPELPYETLTFLVPPDTRIAAVHATTPQPEVPLASARTLTHARPMATTDGELIDPPSAGFGKAAGTSGTPAFYPGVLAEPAGVGDLHGYRLATIRVYPVRYEARTGRVQVSPTIDLEIELAAAEPSHLERQRYSAEIETRARDSVRRLVRNPEAIEAYSRRIGEHVQPPLGFKPSNAPSLEGSAVEYVIITRQSLAANMQVLADWKTRRGVPTTVRTVEWIQANYRQGSDLQETLRNFIADAYTKWGVYYVLLAGDTALIPCRFGYSEFGPASEEDIPSDLYFACLDGSWNANGNDLWGEAATSGFDPGDSVDMLAEVFVGRLPINDAAQADALVNKIMRYENPTNTGYQSELVLLAEVLFPVDWDPSQTWSMDGADFSEGLAAYVDSCVSVTKLYQNTIAYPTAIPLTLANTLAQLNEGCGIVNHIGHGFRYNMSCGDLSLLTSHAATLTNSQKLFVLYMLNCTASAFDFPCLAEAFLHSPGGAVGVIGSSRAAFALPSRNYNDGFFNALYNTNIIHIGETFVESRLAYTVNTWFDTADHYTHLLYNILADPETVIHTCSLGTTTATLPGSVGLGLTNVNVHVNVDGMARAAARVCLQKGTEAYAFGLTDELGNVVLPLVVESAGSVQVTVSGQNMTTHLGTLTVTPAPGAYVHANALSFEDDAIGGSNGNANAAVDGGETIDLGVTFRNDGTQTATGVTSTLQINSAWATVLDGSCSVGTVAAGASVTVPGQLRFQVAANTPDGTVLKLELASTNGTLVWNDCINAVVRAPEMELTLLDVADAAMGNGDGLIQAGETFDLVAYFKNYGSGAANGLQATLASSDPDVSIAVPVTVIGSALPLQEVTGATRFRLTETILAENLFLLTLTDSHGRALQSNITLRGPAEPAMPLLDATKGANTIVATWDLSSEPDMAGYHLYRSTSGGGPWARITADRTRNIAYFRDTDLAAATEYFYYCTAIDSAGNESPSSNIVSINTSPAQLAGWPINTGAPSSCPLAVGDITGDGEKEIVAGNDHLYAWDWHGIELRDDDNDPQTWGVCASEVSVMTAAVVLADFDPAPGFEVFATTWDDSNKCFVVRGDGSIKPGWPQQPDYPPTPRGFWASPAAADIDGDGLAEVFAPSKNGRLYAWHGDGTPVGATAAFKSGLPVWSRCSPSLANVDGDPEPEIIYGAPNGTIYIWNRDGTDIPEFPRTAGTVLLSSTAVGDVNNDGTMDVVVFSENDLIYVFNTRTGEQLPGWPKPLSASSNPITPSPALADFNFDGFLEIVIANNANPVGLSAVQVYDYQGNVLPGWPRPVNAKHSEGSPIVADVSGDGVPDILFGNESGYIFGWDKDGNELVGFPLFIGDFVRSTPYANDVDGDGNINLMLSGWDQNVYIWDFTAPYVAAAAQWPTFKHDQQRTGYYNFHTATPTDAGDEEDDFTSRVPKQAFLSQNVPNPFNPMTRIEYGVPQLGGSAKRHVELNVYDTSGHVVRHLLRGTQAPGTYSALWDGRNDAGHRVASGVYLYRLQVDHQLASARKMLMLK